MLNAGTLFDDLEDAHEWESECAVTRPALADLTTMAPSPMFKERCAKCNGSGRWGFQRRSCFGCNGAGFKSYRTDPATRAAGRIASYRAKTRAAASVADKAAGWREANPALAQWIAAKSDRFDFARAMADQLTKRGEFSAGQLAAIERLAAADAARDIARTAERAAVQAAAPACSVAAIETAFAAARADGIKRPLLRLAGFRFSPAPDTGRNAGAIYVKATAGGAYLGKIAGGKFVKGFECDTPTAAEVVAVATDPEAAAVAYGKRFGRCACCGAELSNPESVARGIGPICAGRFGW